MFEPIDEMLEGMLMDILDLSSAFSADFYQDVQASLNTYHGGSVLSGVDTIMKGTVFAVGASLLTLFILMEFVAIISRYDSSGGLSGVRLPANLLIKFGIWCFLYCNLGKVMLGIQAVATNLATSVTNAEITFNSLTLSSVVDAFTGLSIFAKLLAFVVVLIVWLAIKFLSIVINTLVFVRIFELFLLYTFAPIPLATLPSSEFRSVAFNYLKNFSAVCLQGVVILTAFKLYNLIILSLVPTDVASGECWSIVSTLLLPMLGYYAVLTVAVFNSGRLSKAILNAM